MAKADRRAADAAMAARMKAHPSAFPDSAARPWQGNGAAYRKMAVGGLRATSKSHHDFGLLGGLMCARLGMGSYGIPKELL